PSAISAAPTVGSTSPSVTRAALTAAATASSSNGPTRTGDPAASFTAASSESSRKREQATSYASTVSCTAARAVAIRVGSVAARTAVVPSAGNVLPAGLSAIRELEIVRSHPTRSPDQGWKPAARAQGTRLLGLGTGRRGPA